MQHSLVVGEQEVTEGRPLFDVLLVEEGGIVFGWVAWNLLTEDEAFGVALAFCDQRAP